MLDSLKFNFLFKEFIFEKYFSGSSLIGGKHIVPTMSKLSLIQKLENSSNSLTLIPPF